eukprot:TRINITY_DN67365_c5_g4_i1.p1 TRINITY_DN67365_c5_g4~~TRINITY_DN67365_c5_g4_i1.p1  ORF type:complete len:288 (+),score=160.26 TRINITY_DN67365_c5_g4_i1:47-865(+)
MKQNQTISPSYSCRLEPRRGVVVVRVKFGHEIDAEALELKITEERFSVAFDASSAAAAADGGKNESSQKKMIKKKQKKKGKAQLTKYLLRFPFPQRIRVNADVQAKAEVDGKRLVVTIKVRDWGDVEVPERKRKRKRGNQKQSKKQSKKKQRNQEQEQEQVNDNDDNNNDDDDDEENENDGRRKRSKRFAPVSAMDGILDQVNDKLDEEREVMNETVRRKLTEIERKEKERKERRRKRKLLKKQAIQEALERDAADKAQKKKQRERLRSQHQ